MQRKRFYATQLMKLCFQALLYASLFASFFGMLSITNEAILNITRTAGTTIATFVLTMLLLTGVYGGYDIGVKKMRSVFASISLATFFTDLITYVMLQIMNTNPNNPEANPSFTFWGEDLALLFGAFILQVRRGVPRRHPGHGGSAAGSLLLQAQQNHLSAGRAGGRGHLHRPAEHSG